MLFLNGLLQYVYCSLVEQTNSPWLVSRREPVVTRDHRNDASAVIRKICRYLVRYLVVGSLPSNYTSVASKRLLPCCHATDDTHWLFLIQVSGHVHRVHGIGSGDRLQDPRQIIPIAWSRASLECFPTSALAAWLRYLGMTIYGSASRISYTNR